MVENAEKNIIIEGEGLETIEAQTLKDVVEDGQVEIEKNEKILETNAEIPKKKRGRPKKEEVEARKKEQARQYLEGLNLVIPDGYKLTDQEIYALVETGADKILRWLGGMGDSDMAFWMVVYGIVDARLHITQKLVEIAKNKAKNMGK